MGGVSLISRILIIITDCRVRKYVCDEALAAYFTWNCGCHSIRKGEIVIFECDDNRRDIAQARSDRKRLLKNTNHTLGQGC